MDKILPGRQQSHSQSENKNADSTLAEPISDPKKSELLADVKANVDTSADTSVDTSSTIESDAIVHPPTWSVADAKALRQQDARRMALQQRWLAPIAHLPVRSIMRLMRKSLERRFHKPQMQKLSNSANQYADGAFVGYTPVANDVIAAGGFKAGTNLLMHICYQISELGEAEFDHIQDVMPWPDAAQPKYWMNLFDQSAYQSRTGRRVIKTNLPATKLPINERAKYIAVTRDPKDCAASSFFYYRSLNFGPTAPPPEMWLDHVASDDAPFGRWDTFTASWYALRDEPNVLFLHYEEMKNNPDDTVISIAEFLDVELSDDALDKIVQKTYHFDTSQLNRQFFPATQTLWTNKNDIIVRKGQSGDGVALFDETQLRAFDAQMALRLTEQGSDFPYADSYAMGENV